MLHAYRVKTHLRVVQATTKRYNDRSTAEAQQQRRRTAEAAAFAKDFDEFMAAGEDPSAKEINLKAMQQQVQEQLEEDADAVGPEPPRYAPVIHPVQVGELWSGVQCASGSLNWCATRTLPCNTFAPQKPPPQHQQNTTCAETKGPCAMP